MKIFSNLDSEIVVRCVIEEIEREIKKLEATTTNVIEMKQKINAAISTKTTNGVSYPVSFVSSEASV